MSQTMKVKVVVISKTAKALQVRRGAAEDPVWIPLSLVRSRVKVQGSSDQEEITVPSWKGKELGWNKPAKERACVDMRHMRPRQEMAPAPPARSERDWYNREDD